MTEVGQSLKETLVQSCKENNVEQVKYILSHRLEELSQKTLNRSFLVSICSASYSDENVEIVRLLLEHGVDVNYVFEFDCQSFLQWSITQLKLKIVELIILHGADLNYSFYDYFYAHKEKRDALIFIHRVAAFENVDFETCRRLVYLMLFRNAQTCLCFNYCKKYPMVQICFPHWQTEMLLYCLDRKKLSHLIISVNL